MTGPADVWFGIGFNAQSMADLPYAIVVSGESVMEVDLANHAAGANLTQTIKVVSNTVTGTKRTVVMTRAMTGPSASYYSFDPVKQASINFIVAYGTSMTYGYHASKGASSMTLVANSTQTCVCITGVKEFIGQGDVLPFGKNCREEPWGDLAHQHNPTCTLDSYAGGLACCHHQNILLDKD